MTLSVSSVTGRRLRLLLPTGVAIVVLASLAFVPGLFAAQTVPSLPAMTAEQLVAKAAAADVPGFTGVFQMTANLGLPDLGEQARSSPVMPLIAGTHMARVERSGTSRERIAVLAPLDETDLIRNGADAWVWEASKNHAIHVAVPQDAAARQDAALTPDAIAKKLLDAAAPSTTFTVGTAGVVAGRPVYDLVLAPKSPASLVDTVVVSVDCATGLPLRVRVSARGDGKPALDVGFTKIDFTVPPDSDFAFTPPPNATVEQASSPGAALFGHERRWHHRRPEMDPATRAAWAASDPASHVHPSTIGTGWDTIAVLPGLRRQPAVVQNLLASATKVSGAWGSGRVIHTALVHVLILDDGRVLAGAVDDSALEAAVAQLH